MLGEGYVDFFRRIPYNTLYTYSNGERAFILRNCKEPRLVVLTIGVGLREAIGYGNYE